MDDIVILLCIIEFELLVMVMESVMMFVDDVGDGACDGVGDGDGDGEGDGKEDGDGAYDYSQKVVSHNDGMAIGSIAHRQ